VSSPRIAIAVEPDDSLYRSEGKIYPRETGGRFQRLRIAALVWLLGMFYLVPWLSWDGRQALLFDLPARKFYVFGLVFWPQDFIFLALLLVLAGLSLFFFTALAGRLWCGFACPQTVWTEAFIWIEQRIEGDRRARMRLDAAPWSADKLRRKLAKHSAWLLLALWTGFTFVGFFTPIRELAARAWPFQWGGWETFWVLFYALATWGNAGFLREQVCKYMCPYARFQSAMFDRGTLIIAYDPMRGEPRGARKRGLASVLQRARGLLGLDAAQASVVRAARAEVERGGVRVTTGLLDLSDAGAPVVAAPEDLGDCIDCTICVQVCPTGIDIRNGLQYECIACAACIDACDEVMAKLDYPPGLIRFTTQNALDGRPSRILRPRVLVYGALLTAILAGWAWGISQRSPLIVDVLRDRNALYRVADGGLTENAYTLKISNKDVLARTVTIAIEAPPGIALVGAPLAPALAAETTVDLAVTLRAATGLRGRHDVTIVVARQDDPALQVRHATAFFAPQ
jgi:polyferredoxin